MWALVLVSCGVASGLGYLLVNTFSGVAGDRMAALAGVGTVLAFCIPLMF